MELIDKYSDFNAQGLRIFLYGLVSQTIVDLSFILFNQAASIEVMLPFSRVTSPIDL